MKPKNNRNPSLHANLSASSRARRKVIAGIDLGDRKHVVSLIDAKSGDALEEVELENSREVLLSFAARWPKALMVMEAGTHSPWISRLLEEAGHEVLVANPRETRAIWKSDRKCDLRDARMLAKIARVDVDLKLKARGGRGASGKAAVAVARKLAVTMTAMLRDEADYRAFAESPEGAAT